MFSVLRKIAPRVAARTGVRASSNFAFAGMRVVAPSMTVMKPVAMQAHNSIMNNSRSFSSSPLSPEHTALIKATIPVLEAHGTAITKTFYTNLFHDFPSLFGYFPPSHQGVCPFDIKTKSVEDIKTQMMNDKEVRPQQGALAGSVLAAAKHIDDLSAIVPVVMAIAHKHCSLLVTPEQYDIVGAQLIAAIKQTLGDAATPEIIDAWTAYYGVLAKVFIDAEKGLYEAAAKQKNGWTGMKKFVVAEKIKEADDVFSFVMKAKDGSGLPIFAAGQYIAFAAEIPDVGPQRRNYSLSAPAKDNTFRISVKRDATEGKKDGAFSSWLHDTVNVGEVVELSTPYGVFGIDAYSEDPLLFLSAGIGQTPLVAMYEDLMLKKSVRPITFIRQCKNSAHDELHKEISSITHDKANVTVTTFYSEPLDSDVLGEDYDVKGTVKSADLYRPAHQENLQVYMCGPQGFQFDMAKYFNGCNLKREQLHSHAFGPMSGKIEEGWNSCPMVFKSFKTVSNSL